MNVLHTRNMPHTHKTSTLCDIKVKHARMHIILYFLTITGDREASEVISVLWKLLTYLTGRTNSLVHTMASLSSPTWITFDLGSALCTRPFMGGTRIKISPAPHFMASGRGANRFYRWSELDGARPFMTAEVPKWQFVRGIFTFIQDCIFRIFAIRAREHIWLCIPL